MSNYPPQQVGLPTDPMENVGGSRYLRLSNECPKEGVILSLERPTIMDSKFTDKTGNPKKEYQWPCTQFMPMPVDKTLVESSPHFCTALKKATKGEPYGKVLQIQWTKEYPKGGNPIRVWSIREISEADVKQIFG